MNIELEITTDLTGATSIYTLRDTPDWSVLVNRVITKRFGAAAAKNRQTIRETEYPVRTWSGTVNGATYTIEEVATHPALTEVSNAANTVRAANEALTVAQGARDQAVRAALAAGVSVKDLGPASGLSKERVYQIRDSRR